MMQKLSETLPQQGFFDLLSQLDSRHELILLSTALNWSLLESSFIDRYSELGRPAKPIRLMSGLLILKQLYNLSDQAVVNQWQMNPYYQYFCGSTEFQHSKPCDSSELTVFRHRIGSEGVEKIFALSVALHGDKAEEATVLVDTTVQEKAITYPTDSKLAIKVINRLNKLAKANQIKQRRTYVKEVRELRLACRHFRHVKRRSKAKKALKRLRTIAGALLRELQRKLPAEVLAQEADRFAMYEKVLNQQLKDKNKIYSLHEPEAYCVGKGKDHKAYEYGSKASVVSTLDSQIIIGVASHADNIHDSKTLKPALDHAHSLRKSSIDLAVVDRGYRGAKQYVDVDVLIPGKPLKRDNDATRERKRRLCQQRSAIEPIIGHLKQQYRLTRNWLRGSEGDEINLLMSACAWNLKKWMAFAMPEINSSFICYVLKFVALVFLPVRLNR